MSRDIIKLNQDRYSQRKEHITAVRDGDHSRKEILYGIVGYLEQEINLVRVINL